MSNGYEWLRAWRDAPSVWKRAVGTSVKALLEIAVFAGIAAVVVAPIALLHIFVRELPGGAVTIASVWSTVAILVGKQEFCFTTTPQAADRDQRD
jgi:hypothetical protein